jgi:hypothetical protein
VILCGKKRGGKENGIASKHLTFGWPLREALVRERPGRPVIGDVLFDGLALTKQALDNSLSETSIAIRFSECVPLSSPRQLLFRPKRICQTKCPSLSLKAVDRCGARS